MASECPGHYNVAMPSRILLIEDEPSIAENVLYALETEGFAARWEATGGAGAAAFAAWGPDLVLLDVGLPDISGFDWFRELRRSSDAPVIFLTARADEIDRVVGLELGADDYVTKPFSPRELAARVRAVLRRASPAAPPPNGDAPVPGGFRILAEQRQIQWEGRPLDLSPTEYRILSLLLRSPGRVYAREQIMDQAWDEPEASGPRTVDAHIKTLRAKLAALEPARQPIRTHRGFGYSFDPEA